MEGSVKSDELDALLKLGHGFMGAKSGCCDWSITLDSGTLDIQALAKGHDQIVGLFRVFQISDRKDKMMRLAPGVTMRLTVRKRSRGFGRSNPDILFDGVFDKLDEFLEVAKSWVLEGKMKVAIVEMVSNIP